MMLFVWKGEKFKYPNYSIHGFIWDLYLEPIQKKEFLVTLLLITFVIKRLLKTLDLYSEQ